MISTATRTIIPPKIFHITTVSVLLRRVENKRVRKGSIYKKDAALEDLSFS